MLRGGRDAAAVARLVTELTRRLVTPGTLPPLLMLAPEAPEREADEIIARIARLPRDVEVIVQTSGSSTGVPDLVGLSVTNLLSSALATLLRLAGCPEEGLRTPATLAEARAQLPDAARATWITGLPVHHIAGLQVITRSILANSAPIELPVTGGFRPAALAAAAAGHDGATRLYTSLVPTQLRSVVADEPSAHAIASACDAVLVGGAALPTATASAAAAAGIPVVRTYGMSETGGGCVYDGTPLAGVDVEIEQPDASGIGRIRLTGPMVIDGYLTSGAAINPPRGDGRTILTSDLGRLTDGVLTVLGRADDVIISGGANIAPLAVEQLLAAAGFTGHIVGVPDPTWGALVTFVAEGSEPELDALRAALADQPAEFRPRAVVAVDRFPTRGPGKVDRRHLTQLAADALAAGAGQRRDRS